MNNILIVEDDSIQASGLKLILESYNQNFKIYTAANASEAAAIYNETLIDLFLLDVDLSNADSTGNGIDIGISLRTLNQYRKTPIMYITGIPEKVQAALNDVHCVFYLNKPYKTEDVHRALDYITSSEEEDNTYAIRDTFGVSILIKYSDILYIKSVRHTLSFYTNSGVYHSRDARLADITASFPSCFIKVHKSYIVNSTYITAYDKTNRMITINGESIPVGPTNKNTVEAAILLH